MEMIYSNGPDGGPGRGPRRFIKRVLMVLVLATIAALIWYFANDQTGVRRVQAPQVSTIIPLPPPPPSPKEKPPEKPVEEDKTPVEQPTPSPKPAETPKPTDNQPKQMTMNATAQAGTDSFNIGAGDGSGMAGSGGGGTFGNATYKQYIGYVLQRAVESDKQVQANGGGSRFSIDINLWMDANGRITQVTLAQSTGESRLDDAVLAAVQAIGKVDEPPPPNASYPVLVKLHGRQPG